MKEPILDRDKRPTRVILSAESCLDFKKEVTNISIDIV